MNSMPERTLFTWIHLSDIHQGHGDSGHRANQTLVLDSLYQDIRKMTETAEGLAPDALLITGDVAFSGGGRVSSSAPTNTEYHDASEWLRRIMGALIVPPEKVFVVPGNHDVDRGAGSAPEVADLLLKLREGAQTLDSAAADANKRDLLAQRFQRYAEFEGQLRKRNVDTRFHWREELSLRGGIKLRIVGLNSAVLAADDQDRGLLAVGESPIAETLTQIADNEVVFVLSHHPLSDGWLRDQEKAGAWIASRAHVHLSGHIHSAASEFSRKGIGTEHIWVGSGAAHNEARPGAPPDHGYSFGQIVLASNQLRVRIWPRRWTDQAKTFVTDAAHVKHGRQYSEHPLLAGAKNRSEAGKRNFQLKVINGPLTGRTVALTGRHYFVGRYPGADLQFPDKPDSNVSRWHASLLVTSDAVFVCDESTDGTLLNGDRIEKGRLVRLAQDDVLQIGESLIQLARAFSDGEEREPWTTPKKA